MKNSGKKSTLPGTRNAGGQFRDCPGESGTVGNPRHKRCAKTSCSDRHKIPLGAGSERIWKPAIKCINRQHSVMDRYSRRLRVYCFISSAGRVCLQRRMSCENCCASQAVDKVLTRIEDLTTPSVVGLYRLLPPHSSDSIAPPAASPAANYDLVTVCGRHGDGPSEYSRATQWFTDSV